MDGEFELGTANRYGDRGREFHVAEDEEEESVLVEKNGEFILLPKRELEALDLLIVDEDNDKGTVPSMTREELSRNSETGQGSLLEYPVIATSCETTSCTSTASLSTPCRPFPDSPPTPSRPEPPGTPPPPVPSRARMTHSPTLASHEGRARRGSSPACKSARPVVNSYVPPATAMRGGKKPTPPPHRLTSAPSSTTRKQGCSPGPQNKASGDSASPHALAGSGKRIAGGDNSPGGRRSPDESSRRESDRRRLRNEQAFQEWLAHKKAGGQSPRAFAQPKTFAEGGSGGVMVERPSTALPTHTGTWPVIRTNSDAFENWLKRKQGEMKARRDVDSQRKNESTDQERSVDGEKAFQIWLEKKKAEERTRAKEFKAFQRIQIEEARKIKWSLDQRYKGMK